MEAINQSLWLFDYNEGEAYENFSRCEDSKGLIYRYLEGKYDLRGLTVLEIGAGSGKFTSFLAQSCNKLYVVERSASLMAINQAKNHHHNIEFILSDIKELNLPEHSVDVVFGGWSMTSMRDDFPNVFRVLSKVLKKDGEVILVENAGGDEFSRIAGIEELSAAMLKYYHGIGFHTDTVVITFIALPNAEVFYRAFPNQRSVKLESLTINHNVVILSANAKGLPKGGE